MDTLEAIKLLSARYFEETRSIRRHIHRHPELSFREYETSAYVACKLKEYGIPYRRIAENGIIGEIKGKGGGKRVALRAELDALPVQEETRLPFASIIPGVMHACGHDVHTACLLGAGRILKEIEPELKGSIMLIFQPGEETLPGGAKQMLEEGLFEESEPFVVIAQHVLPELPAGKTAFRKGLYMASGDELFITVKGKGGHAATPSKTVNTVLIAAKIITELHQLSDRDAPAGIPSVLAIGKVTAEGATNVIPKEVRLEGTFRTMDEKWRSAAHERIMEITTNAAKAMGGDCKVEIRKGYPALVNNPEYTEAAARFSAQYLGNEMVEDMDIRMTTEDFAYFAMKYPAVFFRTGTGMADKKLHTPVFDIDEEIIENATGNIAWLAYKFGCKPLVQ